MDIKPAAKAVQLAAARVDDEARRFARLPDPVQSAASGAKDTVQLSAEAVALLMSRDAIEASIEVIKTGNGMSRALLNLRR